MTLRGGRHAAVPPLIFQAATSVRNAPPPRGLTMNRSPTIRETMTLVDCSAVRAAQSGDLRSRLRVTDERGIALLEVVIAGVILSVAMIGLALMFSLGMSFITAEGGERIAVFLAQQRMEELRAIGLARAFAEAERDIPGFPGFRRTTTIVGGTDLDGSGEVPRVITVSVRSTIRQAGPVTVTAVYNRH